MNGSSSSDQGKGVTGRATHPAPAYFFFLPDHGFYIPWNRETYLTLPEKLGEEDQLFVVKTDNGSYHDSQTGVWILVVSEMSRDDEVKTILEEEFVLSPGSLIVGPTGVEEDVTHLSLDEIDRLASFLNFTESVLRKRFRGDAYGA